jgi:hypothetical protein
LEAPHTNQFTNEKQTKNAHNLLLNHIANVFEDDITNPKLPKLFLPPLASIEIALQAILSPFNCKEPPNSELVEISQRILHMVSIIIFSFIF